MYLDTIMRVNVVISMIEQFYCFALDKDYSEAILGLKCIKYLHLNLLKDNNYGKV